MSELARQRVHTSDGASFELVSLPASTSASRAAVALCLPAMGIGGRYYEPLVRALSAAGVASAAMDLRGIDTSSLRASRSVDFGYAELVERDLPAAIDAVERLWPRRPIVLVGHSLGGQLAALYAATAPGRIAALALVATALPYYRRWPRRRLLLALNTQLAWGIAAACGHFPGQLLGFAGREARGVMRDWAYTARTGRYQLANTTCDYEQALRRVRLPVLAISLNKDRLSPRSAIAHFLEKMPDATIERWHYVPEDGAAVDHNRWPRTPAPIVSRLVRWMDGSALQARTLVAL